MRSCWATGTRDRVGPNAAGRSRRSGPPGVVSESYSSAGDTGRRRPGGSLGGWPAAVSNIGLQQSMQQQLQTLTVPSGLTAAGNSATAAHQQLLIGSRCIVASSCCTAACNGCTDAGSCCRLLHSPCITCCMDCATVCNSVLLYAYHAHCCMLLLHAVVCNTDRKYQQQCSRCQRTT